VRNVAMNLEMIPFEDVLLNVSHQPDSGWLFMKKGENWGPDSLAAVLELEEVSKEEELDPDAGVPRIAKEHRLAIVMPITTLQDIVANASAQRPSASVADLFAAFEHYYQHDAFIDFSRID